MNRTNTKQPNLTRRDALKTLAALTGAAGLALLPRQWQTPTIEVGVLPVHAQTSGQASYRLINLRQLTACENMTMHHIFINVLDSAGQGINGLKIGMKALTNTGLIWKIFRTLYTIS